MMVQLGLLRGFRSASTPAKILASLGLEEGSVGFFSCLSYETAEVPVFVGAGAGVGVGVGMDVRHELI